MKKHTYAARNQEWLQARAQSMLTPYLAAVPRPDPWEVLPSGQGMPLTPEVHARLLELALEAQRSTSFPPRPWCKV